MKYLLSILLSIASLAGSSQAHQYYISSSYAGVEAGTITQPYRNWSSVSSKLVAGDSVFFKRGDVWAQSTKMTVGKSGTATTGIYIGAYGEGPKPVISNLKKLTNWVSDDGGFWHASVSGDPNLLVFDDNIQGKGRYPKDTFFIYTGSGTTNKFTDSKLPDNPSWAGSTVIIRQTDGQRFNASTVVSNINHVVTYSDAVSLQSGNGYYFVNDLKCLSRVGDWMYDSAAGVIRMFFGNDNPNSHVVKVPIFDDDVIFINGGNYVTLQNICIEGGTNGLHLKNNMFDVIDSNEIRFCQKGIFTDGGSYTKTAYSVSGRTAYNNVVNTRSASNHTFTNNYVHDLTQYGAHTYVTCVGNTFSYNRFENFNLTLHTGVSGGNTSGYGIYILGDSTTFSHNVIRNVGFMGVYASANYVYILNNLIDGYSLTKDDAGGIYFYSNGADNRYLIDTERYVMNNIILNGSSTVGGENNKANRRSHAIYMDFAGHVRIENNTVINCGGYGIKIGSANFIKVRNNIVSSPYNYPFDSDQYSGSSVEDTHGCTFYGNIGIAGPGGAWFFHRPYSTTPYNTFGSADSNYYITSKTNPFQMDQASSFTTWKSSTGFDNHSIFSSDDKTETRVEYNTTLSDKTINLNPKVYKNLKTGQEVSGSITLQSYNSAALMYVRTATDTTPVYVPPPIPPAPPAPIVKAVSNSTATLIIQPVNMDSVTYNLYRATGSSTGTYTKIASGLDAGTYTSTGLAAGTTYYYKVTAVNVNNQEGPYSAATSATTVKFPRVRTKKAFGYKYF